MVFPMNVLRLPQADVLGLMLKWSHSILLCWALGHLAPTCTSYGASRRTSAFYGETP